MILRRSLELHSMNRCPWCWRWLPDLVPEHKDLIYTCNDCLMGDVVYCKMGDEPTEESKPAFQVKERDPMLEPCPEKGTAEYMKFKSLLRDEDGLLCYPLVTWEQVFSCGSPWKDAK